MNEHMNGPRPEERERKIISKKGVSIDIRSNTDSALHGDKISLGVGGMEKLKNVDYAFAKEGTEKGDIAVGKEGTLIYSRVSGESVAKELKYAGTDEQKEEKLLLIEKLLKTPEVADIHQIEVLPEFQGKGIAAALLDVAEWDIKDTNKLAFSTARVLFDNPDREKILGLFERSGFKKFYRPRGFNNPAHWIVIRENTK